MPLKSGLNISSKNRWTESSYN